jgi:hypothetical protein
VFDVAGLSVSAAHSPILGATFIFTPSRRYRSAGLKMLAIVTVQGTIAKHRRQQQWQL